MNKKNTNHYRLSKNRRSWRTRTIMNPYLKQEAASCAAPEPENKKQRSFIRRTIDKIRFIGRKFQELLILACIELQNGSRRYIKKTVEQTVKALNAINSRKG
ncbi:MAG: hypothetical protein IJI66_01880 [Erysipelotrichaceae bacterium]|nr:hypothetical protein [Erysipelotrichaceae bacterium]